MNTINVNLKPCDCTRIGKYRGEYPHFATCSATPILIPCPIPRTVEMTVRVGECEVSGDLGCMRHGPSCPARPIRFTCTIGGDGTWAGSGVSKVDPHHEALGRFAIINDAYALAYAACRERWAIVKALVTGKRGVDEFTPPPQCLALMEQRDAVFAALADMARDEDMHEANRHALFAACPAIFPRGGVSPRPLEDRPSSRNLAAYVSHLIAKVGAL